VRCARRSRRAAIAFVASLLGCVLVEAAFAAPQVGVAPAMAPATAAYPGAVRDIFPGVANAYLVTVDEVPLFGAATTRPLPPASLAKLVAALVVVDAVDGNTPVTVSGVAAAATGSRARLRAGERLRARDLLAAMLIASANDACLALAEHASGSERGFVARMNERAKSLGLAATRFENACGFDAPRMTTTAADLVVVAQAALAQPAIATWTALESHAMRTLGGREIVVRNTNAFVGRVPGVTGLKTGYTAKAGRNLVLTAIRDGHRATVVLLGAQDRWWDAAALLERAFDTTRPAR